MAEALAGRTAVVTGASRGIGAATARSLAAAGARIALVARSAADLDVIAREIGGGSFAVPADLARPVELEAAVARVNAELGAAPDILVNNAGIFRVAPAHEMPIEVFAESVEINLVVPFRVVRAFLPAMRTRGSGHIVTIGSVADRGVFPGNAAYFAAKYGLRGLHEVLRLELRGSGVRTTLVSPGSVDTDLWDEAESQYPPGHFTPRDQMLSPAAVADAVLFCVSRPEAVNIEELRLRRS